MARKQLYVTLRAYASETSQLSRELAAECAQLAAKTVTKLIDAEFRAGKSPDDVAWAPLKDGSGRRPLVRTGALRKSITVTVAANAIKIAVGVPYARYHQNKRPILPASELPPRWIAAVDRSLKKLIADRLPADPNRSAPVAA